MRGIFLIRSRLSLLRASAFTCSRSVTVLPYSSSKRIVQPCLDPPIARMLPLSLCSSFSTSKFDNDNDNDDDEEDEEEIDSTIIDNKVVSEDVQTISNLLKACGSNRKELREKLEECTVKPSNSLVVEILSLSRNDWETAFTFFLWAGKQQGYTHSIREYHSMISILGKMRKFDTAWTLIDEMRKLTPSLVNSQTLLIMIRKYCAVHDVAKAINTFHAYKRFKLATGIDEFQSLLSALCRYKNVQDAEHLIYCNKETYPFEAKSFNIVLNGWCNVIGSPRQAERVWMEMGNVGVERDVVSYSCMMSCYSKGGSLNKVLRLFDRMKKEGIEPDRKAYNAVVHALAKGGFVAEAVSLVKTMEEEKGMEANVVTYNSLIKPLCKGKKTEEAKKVFDEMLEKGIVPTIRTYHAFMRILRTGEEVFEMLGKMREMGCEPTVDTYIMLIRKFCRWRDFDNVAVLWDEMKERGVGPDLSSYIVMIHGMFLNGKVDEAHGYYKEMKEKGLRANEKAEEMIKSWFEGKECAEKGMMGLKGDVCGVDKEGVVEDMIQSCHAEKGGRGQDLLPCECDFKICRDCFVDAVKAGGGMCPGCKEPYRNTDLTDLAEDGQQKQQRPMLPPPSGGSKMERRLSLMKSTKSGLMRSQTGDFDHNRWLFETSGTYGYGNAFWTKDGNLGSEKDGHGMGPQDLMSRPWRPLTRKLQIPAAVISPYRLLIFIRIVVLALFLMWRIKHQNPDAVWLWGMSVVCELWFAFSWLLDQLPKLCPINRATDLNVLKEKFETPTPSNPTGKSDLPGLDMFVSTADPDKEPPLVTSNTILSILAADYPVEKLACYVSDDGGALLTFEAMAEAASFANIWVPFCRKHDIEPRNPDSYFSLKRDPYKNKVKADFVKDRRKVKREYDEYKVRINGLPDSIRRRSDAYHAREEIKAMKQQRQNKEDEIVEPVKIPKATWMADGTHWPGTWLNSAPDHSRSDHAGIIQVMLKPPSDEPLHGLSEGFLDLTDVDIRLPLLVYVSREKRPGYDHNKKAGAMNALVRASAIMSNGPFILNLDCDHYIYNSQALREGMCFMMDRGGDRLCYVQFPQRFEGIDPSDRYANHNTVFFDVNMRALDGLMGPVYVGTGCLFRRIALYGFDPPRSKEHHPGCCSCCFPRKKKKSRVPEENRSLRMGGDSDDDEEMNLSLVPKKFGNSTFLIDSIPVAEFQGRPLADHPAVQNGRPPGALTIPRELLDASTVAEAIAVISCWYEDKTEWGTRIGWIYGSVTEDVVTGYRMHNRGWKSVYCVTKRDAFRGTAPINLTDRLHQVLRWATGSVEIFFSRNNAFLASPRMKILQRIAYLNVGIYPFTSIFLIVYCFLPALSLFSGQFIVQTLNVTFLIYLLIISITLCLLALLEIKWSGISLEEWWRNEQFWLIGGTSAHLAAVIQGLLKVVAGIEISFTLTSKSGGDDVDDEFADLYIVKWTSLMLPPITIMMVNLIAIAVGFSRTIYSVIPQWSKLIGGVFFSFWVLAHLYPFAKGLMGRRGRTPTIVYVWSGLIAITISLLWVAVNPPAGSTQIGGSFTFP